MNVAQSHIVEGLNAFDNFLVALKKIERFLDAQVEYVKNTFAFILYVEHLLAEPTSLAFFTFEVYVGEELHFHHLFTFALTGFAAAAFHVKTKVFGLETAYFRQLLSGKKVADIVVCFDVRHRIRAAALPDRALVDEFYPRHFFNITFQSVKKSGLFAGGFGQVLHQGRIKYITHQRGFPGAAHPAHHRQAMQRNTYIHVFQVVLARAFNAQKFTGLPALLRGFDLHFARHILGGQAFRRRLSDIGIIACKDHIAAVYACFGTHIH